MKLYPLLLLIIAISCKSAQKNKTGGGEIVIDPYKYNTVKEQVFEHCAVATAHPLASLVGAKIMQQGGNAVDAAIAIQWTLAVVYPGAGNIGGGGFLVAHFRDGKKLSIDYREMAPSAANKDMYVDPVTGIANTDLSQNGHLAAGVPGTVAGLFAAHKYARLPMKQLIQPAIDIAANGFVISAGEASGLNRAKEKFVQLNTMTPVFVRQDREWQEGDTLVQKDLAATLTRIRNKGQAGFYEGETAALVVAEMKRGGGIISEADLKNYKAIERTPIEFTYKGYDIISMPPPSSGGIMIDQMLKMLEDRPLPHYGFNTVKTVQLVTEVERRAYADRAKHLGDPDYYQVPVKTMVTPEYVRERMLDYDSTKASVSSNIASGIIKESEQTTHMSVVDTEGNAVSLTTTLNGTYGSKTVVGSAGFLLNNEMDDFSVQAGVANMYGAVGGEANAIAPGKRMLSSMTPTIVLKDGKNYMVVGTPGGTTIITSVLQSIIDVIDFGMNASDAVNKPKFHHQWLPDQIDVESDFPQDVRTRLEAMGYTIHDRGAIGRTEMILVHPDGKLETAGDKRGGDAVAGF